MNESAGKYPQGQPGFALRPFVSPAKMATPIFEVLAYSAQSQVDKVPALLRALDDRLPATYRGMTRLAVSLDAAEVCDTSFPAGLLENVRRQNIEPPRIYLEVCESDVLSETAWRRVIPELAESGFTVVVKHFIADHSNFDILASPHIAGIKVAPLVVADLPGSILARRFLKGLQALASAVNKQLIIDGVESLGQALWLEALGCELLQGPYYGPAIDLSAARHFILEGQQYAAPVTFEPLTVRFSALGT